MIKIKRVYEKPGKNDGIRILVDRLWPRGVSKDAAKIDEWIKDIAPSDNLRKWFAHKEKRWDQFRLRYKKELANEKEIIDKLNDLVKSRVVTLLFAAKDESKNNAAVLSEFLKKL